MSHLELAGIWHLCGSATQDAEQEVFIDDQSDAKVVSAWLEGCGGVAFDSWLPTEGLVLTISEDGMFEEHRHGDTPPDIEWFDIDGVLLYRDDIVPFHGTLHTSTQGVYMLPDEMRERDSYDDNPYEQLPLRVEEDVMIAEFLRRDGELLYRTQNVTTDEVYFNRTLMVYKKT